MEASCLCHCLSCFFSLVLQEECYEAEKLRYTSDFCGKKSRSIPLRWYVAKAEEEDSHLLELSVVARSCFFLVQL